MVARRCGLATIYALLVDVGLSPGNVLRRAGLRGDLFSRVDAALSPEECYRLWSAIEDEIGDPALPVRIVEALSAELLSFQIVLASTRERLARHYLATDEILVEQISYLLGYEEPTSFGRAFAGWTETSPHRLRTGPS